MVTKDLTYSYSADQIRYGKNNFKRSWANKNDVQLLYISLLNNAEEPIHGSQLGFYSDGNKLEMISNKLTADKLGTRRLPRTAYVIPVTIVFYVAWEVAKEMAGVNNAIDRDA